MENGEQSGLVSSGPSVRREMLVRDLRGAM
jgi:hypothetical protein